MALVFPRLTEEARTVGVTHPATNATEKRECSVDRIGCVGTLWRGDPFLEEAFNRPIELDRPGVGSRPQASLLDQRESDGLTEVSVPSWMRNGFASADESQQPGQRHQD